MGGHGGGTGAESVQIDSYCHTIAQMRTFVAI